MSNKRLSNKFHSSFIWLFFFATPVFSLKFRHWSDVLGGVLQADVYLETAFIEDNDNVARLEFSIGRPKWAEDNYWRIKTGARTRSCFEYKKNIIIRKKNIIINYNLKWKERKKNISFFRGKDSIVFLLHKW